MWNWNYTNVNNQFFKGWPPELAYIVGLFIADGGISEFDCARKMDLRRIHKNGRI